MSSDKIRIVIADDLRLQRRVTRTALETVDRFEIVGEAENGQELVEVARSTSPDLVLTDLHMPVMDGGEAIRLLSFALPECVFVCFTLEGEIEKLRSVIAAGAHDFIRKGLHVDQLLALVEAIYERERPDLPPPPPEPAEAGERASLVSVVGAQAGCGASTLACGLAATLARGRRVAYLDFDFQAAAGSGYLGVAGGRGVLDLLQELPRIDPESAASYLTPAHGLQALAGSPRPLDAARRDPALLLRLVESFRAGSDLVILDLEPRLDDATLQLLGASDQVLLATSNHPTDRRAAARWLEAYRGSLPPEGRLRLVQNRRHPGPAASAAELARELGLEPLATLPHDGDWAAGGPGPGLPAPGGPLGLELEALGGRLDAGPGPG